MKISEVMEITSLTKKAINYYEENGLISPSVNKENNYRDYTKEDIEKLKQISVLRNFDIPVKKIREIIVNPKEMEEIFTEHLNKIKAQILNMERSKDIFQLCINDINFLNSDIGKVTDDMMLLKRSLDMSEREKEGYMKKELIRIFPGFFGRYICLKYSNYLDEPIDRREKENAWIHLVKVLDDSHELKVNKEILESMESDEIDWNLLEEIIKNRDKDFYSMNEEDIQNYVDNLYDAELTETDLKLLEQFISYASSKDNIKYMNDLLKLIDEDLKVLSSKYKKFQENLSSVNCKMKKVYTECSKVSADEIENNMGTTTLPEMTFVGCEYKKFIPFGKEFKLVENFRRRIDEISNVINPCDIYTIDGIDSLPQYEKPKTLIHKFSFSFIVGVQVSKAGQIPKDMQVFTIPSHKHAWYITSGSKNLKSFMKNEIPLITFISQAYKIVKFPVLTLYSSDYKGTVESAVYNYMPIE
ncbi:MerR family transcriptional regulator [Clostridium sp. AWRP]|uniref:MerR family transcriptional regulator n=1 Tax=Clostridium sp. AWRP TaxID=2212991 RepID=UPI000FDA01B6|nr:MerR family transcriptional regulator [Clostridium sp. AWRP]AZV58248.1 MerR family transcriptional regulator [Clostridium sp. AWRP]